MIPGLQPNTVKVYYAKNSRFSLRRSPAHAPPSEEVGYEEASPLVREGPAQAKYPQNPVVHRGQDPELYWMGKHGAAGDEGANAKPLAVDTRSLYRAGKPLKIEIDDEAFDRLYGHRSHPFSVKPNQKIAIRVISQFGEETTKVVEV